MNSTTTAPLIGGNYQEHLAAIKQDPDRCSRARRLKVMAAAAAAKAETTAPDAEEDRADLRELSEMLERLAWAELGQVVIPVDFAAAYSTLNEADSDPGLTQSWADLAAAVTVGEFHGAVLPLANLLAGTETAPFVLDRFFDALESCSQRPQDDPALLAFLAQAGGQEGE